MTDHNLPTLPVVDPTDRLLGVITVDDVLAATLPSTWRDREPPTRPTRTTTATQRPRRGPPLRSDTT